ncbi:MAG: type IV pilus modification protein PilV [Pseudomonadaceae bacterium]|nr:type IV pilus modification protein PilV [Pseudomonadaceae bacterium]
MSSVATSGLCLVAMNKTMRKRRSGGFSMIELLVAVLIMGIGVLGISAMQMVSLQNNRGALLRAEAVQLGYDMLDRIRANPAGTPAGSDYDGIDIGDAPAGPTDCFANVCSQAQMVAFDQAVWKCSLGNFNDDSDCEDLRTAGVLPADTEQPGLPEGDGSIAVDANGLITVTVQWQEPNSPLRSITLESQG